MKRVIKTSLFLWGIMGMVSACAKQKNFAQSEAVTQALSQSGFYPGETISNPGALALLGENFSVGTDGGYIAPPEQISNSTGSSGEGGNIPAPGTTDPVSGNDTGSIGQSGTTDPVSGNDTGSIGQSGTTDPVSGNDSGVQPPPIDPGTVVVDDSGQMIPPINPPKPPTPCSCKPKPTNHRMKFQLRRACSIKRSQGKGAFFEEAKNPILSIESVNQKGAFLAMPGFYTGPKAWSLVSVPLTGVDLLKGKYSGETDIILAAFKKAKGWFWSSVYVDIKVCDDTNHNGFCYDETVNNQLAVDVPDLKAGSIPRSLQINVFSGRHLTKAGHPKLCESQYSPLVFDLKGNGFDFVGPEAGISFDMTDSGNQIPTGWIDTSDDALLVRDLNGNRKIESGAELFGNATRLANGERAINGFEALRALDSDQNGYITSRDKAWTELRLWLDVNQDGLSQPRELMSLDRAGIESISLGYASIFEADSHGNQIRERSTYIRKIRSKRYVLNVADVWFNSFVGDD